MTCVARRLILLLITSLAVAAPLAGCSSGEDTSGPLPPVGGGGAGASAGGGGSGGVAGTLHVEAVAAHESVGLQWDVYAGASSYNVYWSLQPGVAASADVITDAFPGYIHHDLDDGTTYYYTVTAVDGSGEHRIYDEASATPGGDFVLHRLGTGIIEDVVTDGSFVIPIEQRLHAILLPEGYLASELQAGVFDADVDRWHDDVFTIAPYDAFAEAFVIWALPVASAEHVSASDPQQADTAFLVPVTSDGGGVGDVGLTGPTANRVWAALETFPYPPVDFYPPGGSTNDQAKNVLAHIMVLDPDDGESGLSGKARRLQDPADPNQRLTVAIAHNLAHEFTHAFARLMDEYLDLANTDLAEDNAAAVDSAHLANVVTAPDCANVPWSHLLLGGTINLSTDELVGAFGTPELGYHSEFKCLMNGTHDNDLFYGGDGRLRSSDRLCNYCREVTAFRILERAQVLEDTATSWDEWTAAIRGPFFERFGFAVPAVVPQQNSDGTPFFEACAP